jgi:hypothetical protein
MLRLPEAITIVRTVTLFIMVHLQETFHIQFVGVLMTAAVAARSKA